MNQQVTPNHYFSKSYNSKRRFCSYWYQINEVLFLNPESVLEVGIGNGLISSCLKKGGINITTLDINERLNPDYIGSILDMPFPDRSFDVVACYEVLEHLPYKDFSRALSEIFRVSKSYAILSIPDVSKVRCFDVRICKIGDVKTLILFLKEIKKLIHNIKRYKGIRKVGHSSEHYWEIGEVDYPSNKVIGDIEKMGFKIRNTYRAFGMFYHRFFILAK